VSISFGFILGAIKKKNRARVAAQRSRNGR